ncbi:IS3 family transposase [Virgibacillus proomii]|uniref:IS3 family transposase n=1 Tax=Virgibacillus proomii TaxID=84407 RepID=UPI001C10EB47|nr:IS3 family transposase [Virgibacillus proomii]
MLLNKWETFYELYKTIDDDITFYNHDRSQEKLNGFSPVEYRAKAVIITPVYLIGEAVHLVC